MDDGGSYEEDDDGCGCRWKVIRGRFTIMQTLQPVERASAGRFHVTVWKVARIPTSRRVARVSPPCDVTVAECSTGCDAMPTAASNQPSAGSAHCSESSCPDAALVSHKLSFSPSVADFSDTFSVCSDLNVEFPTSALCVGRPPCHGQPLSMLTPSPSQQTLTPYYMRSDSSSSCRTKSYGSTGSLASFFEDGLFSPAADSLRSPPCAALSKQRLCGDAMTLKQTCSVSSTTVPLTGCSAVWPAKPLYQECSVLPRVPHSITSGAGRCLHIGGGCPPCLSACSQFPPCAGVPKRRGRFKIYEADSTDAAAAN